MRHFLFIYFSFALSGKIASQTVSPSVINTSGGGGTVGGTGVELYYNIGEPVTATINNSNHAITQGFLQPDIVGEFSLSITPLFQNESCLNKQDGFISLLLNSVPSSASQIVYAWSPANICPLQNCPSIDSLAPGNYSVVIKALNSSSVLLDSLYFAYSIAASTEPCNITVYNGFTPNGDGINDFWIIENVENFPNNRVTIFNRWGNKIWETIDYNNTSNVWDGKTQSGASITSGTYFYVVEIDGGKGIKKGWVELTGK